MWTPRRVLLLIFGLCVFGCAYGVYARFLGGIDGLPQLPDELLTHRDDNDPFPNPTITITQRKLMLAFGQDCDEAHTYRFQLEVHSKGIVVAFNDYEIDPDGRVRLSPFSLATLKEKTPDAFPEINSIHCDVGFLEFDKPIKVLQEIGTRRIVACELIGDPNSPTHDARKGSIHLTNNRGTPAPDDDLELVTTGPVSYRESSQPNVPLDRARPEIQTSAAVQITDRRNQPQSTTVTAQGMQVFLAVDSPNTDASRRLPPKKTNAVNGVRRIILPTNVNMNLWTEGSGFMGGAKPANPAPPDAKPERTNLQITTIGPFTYDVLPDGDHARFDQLPPSATPLPNSVRVVRPQKRGVNSIVNDQLECDHLELKFASKALPAIVSDPQSKAAAPKSKTDPDKPQIEWIHAWGQFVVLTSDEEKLEARGTELHHDATAKTTTLTGVPETVALKDGNEIHAPKLVIYGTDDKQGQHAEAVGPGYFRMLDRTGSQRTVYARWKERLDYRKDENHDLLTLVGDAMFEDKAGGQTLTAKTLKLLLAPENKGGPKTQAANAPPPRPKPQRLEAYGNVVALAPDLSIRDTEELIVHFKEVAPVASPGAAAPNGAQPQNSASPKPPSGSLPATPNSQPGSLKPSDPTKPKNPIDLRARRVQAFLLTGPGDQTELDRVDCEGDVHVHQAPAPPQTKPTDMAGSGLVLRHTAEGNILEVKGPLNAPGRVTLPDLELIGPLIKIDQVENSADVQGIGSMRIDSQTDMQGKKLDRPVPLTVFWKQKMHFNGQVALFHGHVQADQADTSLLCNNMQVFLNKPVSLSQQTAQSQPQNSSAANVDKVICDNQGQELPQPVTITESVRGPDGRLQKYQRLETNTVAMHKEEGTMEAGEGNVRILQQGSSDTLTPATQIKPNSKPAPNQKPDDEFKLTWVRYQRSLRIDNTRRTATFFKNVEVLHLPMNDPGLQLEFEKIANHLPQGAMYLKCERLDVYSTKDQNGKTNQEFTAKERAEVQAQEFYGRANVIKFDEAKQTIIFEGSKGSLAELYRQKVRGNVPDTYKAEKITYNRQTGEIKTDGTRMMTTGGLKK